MKKIILILLGLSLIFSCKDNPYQEKPEPIPLQTKAYTFSGRVELGAPVYNAEVLAYEFMGLKQGELLGETTSNLDGTYELKLDTAYKGPVLLVTHTGMYRDLVTQENISFKPGQILKSVITHIDMPETTNINAWTTLAAARVQADKGFWDSSVAELGDIERINVDFAHISQFLTGESVRFVNIRRQEFFDCEKDAFKLEDPSGKLHLAHGGLSIMAHNTSRKLADAGQQINVIDLVDKLSEDVSDRIFDGRNNLGAVVYVGNTSRVNLTSYTMRKHLAEAILLYAKRLHEQGAINQDESDSLSRPGRLADSISRDQQPELFPQAEKPKLIDNNKPTLAVRFADIHTEESEFAFLEGPVVFSVEAFDDTQVANIKMLSPDIEENYSSKQFGPILTEQLPQALEAAALCNKEKEFKSKLKTHNIEIENTICACFKAQDVFGHSNSKLYCFQRSRPQANITFPTSETILSNADLAQGVVVEAQVSSGLPLDFCWWHITDTDSDSVIEAEEGIIDGKTCLIHAQIDGRDFTKGNFIFEIVAIDSAGRVINPDDNSARAYFRVAKETPVVSVLYPKNGEHIAHSFITLTGTVAQPDLIEKLTVRYWGVDEVIQHISDAEVILLNKTKYEWHVILGENLQPGEYAYEIMVRDIYGNEQKLTSQKVHIDNQPPIILGATDGITQLSYRQETTKYRQRLLEDNKSTRYIVEPDESAVQLDWQHSPILSRWLPHINNSHTAPVYRFSVSDTDEIASVTYSISKNCNSADKATRKAKSMGSYYEIRITQNTADVDLTKASNDEPYCLSIWAQDQAGNLSNHSVEFFWQPVIPPIAIDMNSSRYNASRKKNDLMYSRRSIKSFFNRKGPLKLKRGVVLGHAILANTFLIPLRAQLKLSKPIYFSLGSHGNFPIKPRYLDIKYFAYDMAKDQVGDEKEQIADKILLKPSEVIIAQVAVKSNYPFDDMTRRPPGFWRNLRVGTTFSKVDNKSPAVDGLILATYHSNNDELSTENTALWGSNHFIRSRLSR